MRVLVAFAFTVFACLAGAAAYAQTDARPAAPRPAEARAAMQAFLATGAAYDPAIATPEEVTGYRTGDTVLPYELIAQYAVATAAASDRISAELVARSHEGRPIYEVIATSPANHARLDAILAARAAIAAGETPSEPQPMVAQVVFGVHGAEPSGFDVAPALIYHLAAAQDEQTRALLDAAVIVMLVTINPDGDARMASWVAQNRAMASVPDRRHRMFDQPWPGARTNHYWFDLNRQWMPAVHPEARAAVAQAQRWAPNISADMHEMWFDATYFFSPGPREGVNPTLPEELFDLTVQVSEGIAQTLDDEGRLYVSAEFFDDYYIGYGSTYQAFLGGVPFLFEQSSTRGSSVETVHGLEHYGDTVAEQFTALYALLRSGAANADALSDYQRRYFAAQTSEARGGGYVFASPDNGRLVSFLELMALHNIDVRALARDVSVDGVAYAPGSAYVVARDQPMGALVDAMFETRIPDGDFVQFYDVSGWTLPLAYGFEVGVVDARTLGGGLIGAPVGVSVTAPALARPAPDPASYAYVIEWGEHYAPRALYRVLDAGLRAHMIPEPALVRTTRGEVETGRGAIVVPVHRQELGPDAIHALLATAAREDGVVVHAATSGLTRRGPDLGSFDLYPIETPSVLMVVGDGISAYDAGAMWFLLDHEMGAPVRMAPLEDLDAAALEGATHLVLVDGAYGGAPEGLADTLRGWIAGGGVLVASRGGAEWAVAQRLADDVAMLGVAYADEEGAGEPDAEEDGAAPEVIPYSEKDDYDAEALVSGVIFEGVVDITHPLGFGYDDARIHLHRAGRNAFEPTANPFGTVVRYVEGEGLLVSGYASDANVERLSGLGSLVAQRSGAGAVILFADEPYFRGYWLGTSRLMMNAVFFATAFEPPYRPVD